MVSQGHLLTLLLAIAPVLGGCGLFVPEIQENPADAVGRQQLVNSIAYNITCEVQDAVDKIYNNKDHARKSTFLDTWGVQIALNLQVEEKSSLNPVTNWIPPSPPKAVFNYLFGGTLAAGATRQDKLNSYYTIQQIRDLGACRPNSRPKGLLLMQSDLGLEEWLRDNVTAGDTGVIQYASDYSDGPLKTNVISHEVKFDITTTGSFTPGFKLSTVLINQSGSLFSITRDRTQDLTITLGPTVPMPKAKVNSEGQPVKDARGNVIVVNTFVPSPQASDAALASQIGLAVSNAVKSALQP